MEYGKKDMYLQLEKGRKEAWSVAAPPAAIPSAAPPTMPMPTPVPMPLPAKPIQAEVFASVEVQTPVTEKIVAEACGFCAAPAMAYIPVQEWGEVYEAEDGFSRGTIFPCLDLPFVGKGGCRYE